MDSGELIVDEGTDNPEAMQDALGEVGVREWVVSGVVPTVEMSQVVPAVLDRP